jgi:hypothetical protein
MWSTRDVLDSLFWEMAHDDMGIYPQAVIRGDVREERTEWQNGWNAAVMEMTTKHGKLTRWATTLTPEQRELLERMLDSDGEPMSLQVRDDNVRLVLGCGDTFAYACADAESFTLDEMPEVFRLWKAHGYYGVVAWIAKKRGVEPVKEYRYDASYLKAKADLINRADVKDV